MPGRAIDSTSAKLTFALLWFLVGFIVSGLMIGTGAERVERAALRLIELGP